jgi:septal ring factor EnvC (AmiA/AmiB activator)
LRRHYIYGAAGGVASFLSTQDPNQLARDAQYLEHLGKARLALIESLRADLKEKAALGESILARRDKLVALEAEQRKQHSELESVKAARKTALVAIADQLRTQRKEELTLRQDEQRLARVIALLARQAAERAAARAAAVAKAAATARAAPAASGPAPTVARRPGSRSEAVVGEVRQAAGPTPTGVSFAQLRGKMRFPVLGELVGRFGAPRAEGGTTWRGVFIRASGGGEVRAVAGGEVVFSDWLRGYGNLIIVDHGDDYLSVYGNNDALLKELGDDVSGGDAIASVGSSGGAPESGLYFEIRHRGQPLDPLLWVRLR